MTDFTQLAAVYRKMDQAYDRVARAYGFQCRGCEDNCCRSLFFHHTFVEKAYLVHGFRQLPDDQRKEILDRAQAYVRQTFAAGQAPESQKIWCPLNRDGRCILYAFRPMICRLHGLPHELNRPGAAPFRGPGCNAGRFDTYVPFDRTPFYAEMAGVEQAFRQRTGKTGRLKETVAQMLVSGSGLSKGS